MALALGLSNLAVSLLTLPCRVRPSIARNLPSPENMALPQLWGEHDVASPKQILKLSEGPFNYSRPLTRETFVVLRDGGDFE